MSQCPFKRLSESVDLASSFCETTNKTNHFDDLTIDEILSNIVHKEFQLTDVDIEPFAFIFKSNMIHNGRLLKKLNPSLLSRLNIPILLESAIMDLIQKETYGKFYGSQSGNGIRSISFINGIESMSETGGGSFNRKETVETQKSALLGLTPEMKLRLKECWNKLTTSKSGNLAKFFDEFYKNFLETDKIGKKLFEGASMANQAQSLMKMLKFILTSIDNPLNLLTPLQKLGVRHLIYGVEKRSFSAFGVSLAKTFESVLGKDEVTPEMKEAWYVLIMKLGEVMMAEYPSARKGWKGVLYCRSRSRGSPWKLRTTLLTHEKLIIYRGQDKIIEEIYLNIIEDIDIVDDELNATSPSDSSSQQCISISTAASIMYFKASNEEEFDKWVEELTVRIRAHQRVNINDESEASEDSRKGSPNGLRISTQESKIKKLKQGLQKKNRHSGTHTQ